MPYKNYQQGKEYQRRYREQHRAKRIAYLREYHRKNKEFLNAKTREYHKKHKDTNKTKKHQYYVDVEQSRRRQRGVAPRNSPEHRLKLKKNAMKLWGNFEWARAHLKKYRTSPNKIESRIIELIKREQLPLKFVGNGDMWIQGRCPDFIHLNKKMVLEVFGEFWHNPKLNPRVSESKTESGTIEHYKRAGYDCRVVHYHDIWRMKDEQLSLLIRKLTI